MQLSDWDIFQRHVDGMPELRKDFFQTRIVDDDRAHFRGFASDCLAAASAIGLFIVLVLADGGLLGGEIKCFWHMLTRRHILRRASPADIPRLKCAAVRGERGGKEVPASYACTILHSHGVSWVHQFGCKPS